MTQNLRETLNLLGAPEEETFQSGRYTLRYQAVDNRKHPHEVKVEGDNFPLLFEVFDNGELTHEFVSGYDGAGAARNQLIQHFRDEIRSGIHASKKHRK